jgi:hypothetical protein
MTAQPIDHRSRSGDDSISQRHAVRAGDREVGEDPRTVGAWPGPREVAGERRKVDIERAVDGQHLADLGRAGAATVRGEDARDVSEDLEARPGKDEERQDAFAELAGFAVRRAEVQLPSLVRK